MKVAKDPRQRKSKVLARQKLKVLGPHENDEVPSPSIQEKEKPKFRPYGTKPPPPIPEKPPLLIRKPQNIVERPKITPVRLPTVSLMPPPPSTMAPTPSLPSPMTQPSLPTPFQVYSDGNRVYLGPATANPTTPEPLPPKHNLHKFRTFPKKQAPSLKPKQKKKKFENPVNYRIYPTNAGKTLLKKPPVTKIGFDLLSNETSSSAAATAIQFKGFLPNSEPYNPIRVPTVPSFMGMHHQMSSNQTLQASMNHSQIRPPHFSPTKTFTKDDEIEAIKIVKHPIMRHHRSGGGHDIRKLREIYTNKKGPLHHSSTSGLFSPNYNDETQSESEHSMEVDSVEQIEDAVADVVQFLLGHFDEAPSNSVNDGGEEYESADAPEENILGNIYASYGHLLEQSNEEFIEPEIDLNPLNPPKEAEIPVVIIDDEKVPIQKPLKKFNREDGEISKSPSPEIITIDDSDDDDCIIEIYDPTPKARYKGQTALGLDLYLNNLGKNVEVSSSAALEPLGLFFDMKLFYQNYETILSQLLNENEERTKYAHGILDKIFDKCVSLPIYFLLSGDVLEETRADDEFSEIQIFIASVSEDKDINVSTLMEPIFNSIKDSNIGNMTFCSDTNVIVIFQNENTIALRPLDKLAWARSSLIYACGNKVGVYKSALLLIKKAIRQFKPAQDLSDFIISFALIHYFQQIEVFPVFDYDLDEIEFYTAVDVEVLKQPTKKANEIFSDFLFFVKHNEDLTLECPFTKEQFDIKDTQLLNTIDLILGK